MIHARADYNRIQDPALRDRSLLAGGSSPIGEDEPVVLFRAQDKHFVPVLEFYAHVVAGDKPSVAAVKILDTIAEQIERATVWQDIHPPKSPDLPSGAPPSAPVDTGDWMVVELMGHVRLIGRVSEEEKFGGKLGRIEVLQRDGSFVTQYFNATSIYRLTPMTEEAARAAMAPYVSPSPLTARWSESSGSEVVLDVAFEGGDDDDLEGGL